jgi:gamma-glutamyltranspeptidase/glutathione hydrolase
MTASSFAKVRPMMIFTRSSRSLQLAVLTLLVQLLCFSLSPAQAIPDWRRGVVASQHDLASDIGVEVLRKGGNAVDAAVAVGLALAVVFPEAGNIGGGGFMLIRRPDGRTLVIDYREMAPAAARREMFIDRRGEVIKGDGGSTLGYRASGVPGTIAGFDLAFRKYGSGKLTWRELLEPACLLAERGYVLSEELADRFLEYKDSLERYPESKRIFLKNGSSFQPGEVFRQPDLGRTLRRIQKVGASEFYRGVTARLIAADMKANEGLVTLADLRTYRAVERGTIEGTYRGNRIVTVPPPSSGGAVLLESLNILEAYDLAGLRPDGAEKYHLLTEAFRRSFADRSAFFGDPEFVSVPVSELISKEYAAKKRTGIDLTKATPSKAITAGPVAMREGMETTHYAVADSTGGVVSNTYTINDLFGSRVTAKGTGILLNDEMDDFASRPDKPNLYGLIQGAANAVQPGKRPLSSMTPTLVFRPDGSFWFAVGARGGPRIITAVLQAIVNIVDHNMELQAAIDQPRIHHQWLPDEILFEEGALAADSRERLAAMGHDFAKKAEPLAGVVAIMMDGEGRMSGAVDSRRDGKAAGY